MNLKEKIIVITGSSQGLGRAMAEAFLAEGSKVMLSSHNQTELEKTASELKTDHFLADVTKPEDLSKLASYVIKKYNRIDIWINNAGIQIAPCLVEEIKPEDLHRIFDINFFGYFYGCQVALRQMKKQNQGLIININSTAGLEGKPNISAYSSSKFAIRGLTESIRKEIDDTNIKIYSIHPGGIQTDLYREKIPDDINEYMQVDDVAKNIIDNLKSEDPQIDLIIKRPLLK